MKRLVAIAVITVAIAGFLLWRISPPPFKLKATATVLVDGVERTGSAVQEYRLDWDWEPQIGNNGAWRLVVRGEAVRVDVPGAEPIYVLISAGTVFNNCAKRDGFQDELKESLLTTGYCEVKSHAAAVRFDPDHTTAVAIPIGSRSGPVEFVGMSYQRSDEPITREGSPRHAWPEGVGPIRASFVDKTLTITKRDFSLEDFF
jgi:hypothetical protein